VRRVGHECKALVCAHADRRPRKNKLRDQDCSRLGEFRNGVKNNHAGLGKPMTAAGMDKLPYSFQKTEVHPHEHPLF
jgi:hypothetical protein